MVNALPGYVSQDKSDFFHYPTGFFDLINKVITEIMKKSYFG